MIQTSSNGSSDSIGNSNYACDTRAFLQTAQDIGDRLCKSAFWHGARCNWIGRSLDDLIQPGAPMSNKALSPEVYEGTSGMAIFLSNLYICSNKRIEEYRKTAEGAIRQALSRAADIPQSSRFGLYSGQAGIAYAAASVGKALDNSEIIEGSLQLARQLAQQGRGEPHMLDVISGNAGGILSLLKIYELLREEGALGMATSLGNELVSAAVKEPGGGWSWDSRGSGITSAMHNLTGFSHGAAGIGHSLLELFQTTGDERFREAATQAYSYEDRWFSEKEDNWPDFRIDDRPGAAADRTQERKPQFAVAWCHGAPGISISRLRAFQILKDEAYLRGAHAGLRTTKRVASGIRRSDSGYSNFTLCHGLSGIGDILLHASKVLNNDKYMLLAADVGSYGIEKYPHQKLEWPCDARTGEMLGLMIGIAGIGNFYLRLCFPDRVSSPLAVMSDN